MNFQKYLFLFLLFACNVFMTGRILAQAGTLDSTFGQSGIVETAIKSWGSDHLSSTAIQNDGKIIAAGDFYDGSYHSFALFRYNTDGSLDNTFGTNGVVITNIGPPAIVDYYIAVQSDQKIVAAGSYYNGSDYDFIVLRYKSNGALDNSFGTNGSSTTHIGNANDIVSSVSIQSDGKIVVAGDYDSGGNNYDFTVVRFTTDGDLDNTFGTSGVVKTPIIGSSDFAKSAIIQNDGKIVVTGYTKNGSYYDFAAVRYNSNGDLDNTFGTGGIVITQIASKNLYGRSSAIQSDGKIIIAGNSYDGSDYAFVTARYQTDGSIDDTFGTDGIVSTPVGSLTNIAYSVVLQNDGKILTAGYSIDGSKDNFTVLRYGNDGTLDDTFGTNGIVITPVGSGNDIVKSVAIQDDGKIIAAGSSEYGPYNNFAVVRYNVDGNLDNLFGTNGIVSTSISTSINVIKSLAIQSDNKIIAAGYTNLSNSSYDNFSIARYNENGKLDNTFGTDGIANAFLGTTGGQAQSVAIQNDGKIVAGGYSNNGSNFDFGLVRYNSNGSIDNTFGTNGFLINPIGSSDDFLNSIALQEDGKIVAAGYSRFSGAAGFSIARFKPDGTLDYTFGSGGVTAIFLNYDLVGDMGEDKAQSVSIQNDGKIVVGGYTFIGVGYAFGVVRLDTNGVIDSTFGGDGIVTTHLGTDDDFAHSMAIQSDGKIILAGESWNGNNYDFALVRYNTNGDLDNTFGANGKVIFPIGTGNERCYSVKIQADGKIILVGTTEVNGSNNDDVIVRLNPDGTFDDKFGANGKITTNIGLSDNYAYDVIMQGDKIIAGGSSQSTTSDYGVFTLVRYLNNDVVPVELASFTANFEDNKVRLNWTTATEINNLGYEIERYALGADRQSWEKIGFVNGHGNSTNTNSYHFIDSKIKDGLYYYRLKQIDLNGSFTYSNTVEANINVPMKFTLEQNYPNPFNPTTKIKYTIQAPPNLPKGEALVQLKIYDILGNEVATLVNKKQQPGNYELTFNGNNLSSGVYLYKLTAGSFTATKKMILLK